MPLDNETGNQMIYFRQQNAKAKASLYLTKSMILLNGKLQQEMPQFNSMSVKNIFLILFYSEEENST